MHFEIFRTNNEYAFQLLDDSEQLMLTSMFYPTVDACVEGVRLFAAAAVDPDTYQMLSDGDKYSFAVQAGGQQVAQSIGYKSKDDAQESAAILRDELTETSDYDVTYTDVRTQVVQRPGLMVDLDSYDFTQGSISGQMGFDAFQRPDNQLYYFHFNDDTGKAFLYSQAYAAEITRDNGIRSVIQNVAKDSRYEIKEERDSYYFILKAVNGREVARSRTFENRNEMEYFILYLKTKSDIFAEQYKKPEKIRTRGGNPPIDKYNFNVPSSSGMTGFELLQEERSRQHYFHFNNDRAEAILYSQGYSNMAGRDNGIRSVIKNSHLEERYLRQQQNGQYYFILKAGNNQEIARSPMFETAVDMEIAIQYLKTQAPNYAAQYQVELRTEEIQTIETQTFSVRVNRLEPVITPVSARNIDQYDFSQKSSTGQPGFEAFFSEINNAYYFHFNDDQGQAILYSESYPNDIVRDNGIESVKKNASLENRWKIIEEQGKYYYTLKAGNNQEIARGPMFETEALAKAKLAFIQANSTQLASSGELKSSVVTPLAAVAGLTALSSGWTGNTHESSPVQTSIPPVAQNITFGSIASDSGAVYIDPLMATTGSAPIQKYIITSLPLASQGLLFLEGTPVEKSQEISPVEVNKLQFQPNDNTMGDIFFRYKAVDINSLHSDEADYRIRVERVLSPAAASAPPISPGSIPGVGYTETARENGRIGWIIAGVAIAAITLVGYWWETRTPKPTDVVAQGNMAEVSPLSTPKAVANKASIAITPEATLDNFQPIALYFNNDYPNPRTQTDKTKLTYGQTYQSYYTQKGNFEKEYTKGLSAVEADNASQKIVDFFDAKVKKGYEDLLTLSDKLLNKLEAGNMVEITVTGFASPLAGNDYNKQLTSRRVSSIENHFRTYKNGQFASYLDKGMLTITEQASGEEAAQPSISDNRSDTRSSWYSPEASAERRVEITNVTIRKPD